MSIKKSLIAMAIAASAISSSAFASIDTSLLEGLKARNVGPATTSGRISDVEAVISNPNIIYAAAASGGIWKSVNAGLNWEPIFDDQDYASIGALAINQSIPDIVWVGTGEGNVRNSVSIGGGIYKTLDGGKSWKKLGLEKTERINRIALHPTNPDIAYAAAMGELWGENEERGVYKTVDGGKTWQKILYVNEKTGATDIRMDPTNPNKLYASMWEYRRWPYRFESGGAGSGLFVSNDGGETWTEKTAADGLPSGDLGRITIEIAPSQPNTVYALVEAEQSALMRSDDGGDRWRTVNNDVGVSDRPFYYAEIEVDPNDPDTIYNIATFIRRSIDGGKTFTMLDKINCCAAGNTIHIDNHSVWINPENSKHIILGNDGGVQITQDKGDSWRFVQNMPISQFYHVRVDNGHPYNIYGGLQDNGSWRGPSEIWQTGGIRNVHWQEIGFGDGFDAMAFPDDITQGYSQSQGGYLSRWNLNTGEEKLIRPNAPSPDVELRFNWNAGLAQDPFDNDTIYYGSQFVHKSTDRGETWQVISDDLSTNKKEWQRYKDSGGLTPDVTAAENYTAIITIAPSPIKQGVIWVGTDDGRIHVTQDGGKTWQSVESKARKAPDNAFVPHIQPSKHKADEAFIVFDNHRSGDMKPYIFKASKFGKKFTNLTTKNIKGYALSIVQDHVDENLLFLGTELGLYATTDGGDSWFKWTQGVPTVSVMDLAIQERENDLVVATHGRSIYVIDDYSALRGMNDKTLEQELALLSVTDGQQYVANRAPSTRFWGDAAYVGDNEEYGVVLTINAAGEHLPHPDKTQEKARLDKLATAKNADANEKSSEATIVVSNAQGDVVRTFRANLHQGVNRIVWGMESDGAKSMPGGPASDILSPGPQVPPGEYSLKVTVNDQSFIAKANALIDPRFTVSVADLEENYKQQHQVVDMLSVVATAAHKLADSKKDIELIQTVANKALKDVKENKEEHVASKLTEKAGQLIKQIGELDKGLRSLPNTNGIVDESYKVTSKIFTAWGYVGSTYGKPSPTAAYFIEEAKLSLTENVEKINRFLSTDLTEFKDDFNNSGIQLLSNSDVISLN